MTPVIMGSIRRFADKERLAQGGSLSPKYFFTAAVSVSTRLNGAVNAVLDSP
jgi:hypothetical protein